MQDDPFSDDHSGIDGDIGMKDGILSDGGFLANIDPGMEGYPISNMATVSDVDKRINGEIVAQLGCRTNPGTGVHPFGQVRFLRKEGKDFCKGQVRILHAEKGLFS